MGAEVPARGSLGTALRAQGSLVPLRQSHRLSALLGRRKGWGESITPISQGRDWSQGSGELQLQWRGTFTPSLLILDPFTSRDLFL